jgi:putative membrane protein
MATGGDRAKLDAADVDATRRTRLASERTYLAWWRTGLTALAVSLGVGKLVPEVATGSTEWPYVLLGTGFGALGLAFIAYGWLRERALERALAAGRYAPLDTRASAVLTLAGVLLAAGTLAVVLLDS